MARVMLPYRGRTGQIEIECATSTATIPVGPFRFVNGARKGQFVPLVTVRRNLAVLIDRLEKARKAKG